MKFAVASRCFLHLTLSLASEKTLKDLNRSQGHHVEVRSLDLANWALRLLRNAPQELNISSIRVDQIRDPEIPIILRPHTLDYILYCKLKSKLFTINEIIKNNLLGNERANLIGHVIV